MNMNMFIDKLTSIAVMMEKLDLVEPILRYLDIGR